MARALVIEKPGPPEVMRLADVASRPLAGSEVRVAVEAAGVNAVDAGNRSDAAWAGVVAPYVVGYEFAGRVEELGEQVDDLQVGDAAWGLLPVRGTRWGAYADEVVADASFVAVRPQALEPARRGRCRLLGRRRSSCSIASTRHPVSGSSSTERPGASGICSSSSPTRAGLASRRRPARRDTSF